MFLTFGVVRGVYLIQVDLSNIDEPWASGGLNLLNLYTQENATGIGVVYPPSKVRHH
jgi:hypothetical protein